MPPETEGISCGPGIDERICPTPVCGMYLKIHKREISIVARITVFLLLAGVYQYIEGVWDLVWLEYLR